MLFLLSPAKSLDFEQPLPAPLAALEPTPPAFSAQAKVLIEQLRTYSPQQIAELMSLSDKLSILNVTRYQQWSARATDKNSRPAALAFNGDVYEGLDARTLSQTDLLWAQAHVCILSGLYGVLRPLDRLQPYRLEMGTKLPNPLGRDLYHFWAINVAKHLNARLQSDISPVVVNLASQEYFKAVDTKALKAQVVECVFQEYRGGQYKVISFMAKRARGLMARFAVQHQLIQPEQLRAFDMEGYQWSSEQSTRERLVFLRKQL